MKIIIGHVLDTATGAKIGEEFYDTDPAHLAVPQHPTAGRQCKDHFEFLAHMNTNHQSREVGGWNEVSQLPGETKPKSRWERVVDACNAPNAPEDHKALMLKTDHEEK